MSGNSNPYDPTKMFKDWIQKSGRAQTEFMKSFGSLMTSQDDQTFNPLETLKEVSEKHSDKLNLILCRTCLLCKVKAWKQCSTLVSNASFLHELGCLQNYFE